MNNTNTKFPNHHLPSNNKFGIVLPQVHNVVKPSQVPTSKPAEDNEKEIQLSEVYQQGKQFYSADESIKYESSPIQNIPQVSKPQGVFDVYRNLKK
jgi:hypothetical protein